jgi:hypothetical protein
LEPSCTTLAPPIQDAAAETPSLARLAHIPRAEARFVKADCTDQGATARRAAEGEDIVLIGANVAHPSIEVNHVDEIHVHLSLMK